jgi:maltose O-acetyltransferase
VRIGKETFINNNCFFLNLNSVTIGENCAIGPEVMFADATHYIGGQKRRAGGLVTKPIEVGNGCWIGARAMILPGVHVGESCVISAGAVVTKNCQANGLYAGVPARRVKDLT